MINHLARQQGISLLEVLVATTIMATIATLAFGALDVSERSKVISEEKMLDLQQFDRSWVLIENDLRNVLVRTGGDPRSINGSEALFSMTISYSGDYSLMFLRGGRSNPLQLPRTELARVGYKLKERTLWRYIWSDPFYLEEKLAYKQKVLEDVEDFKIRVLPNRAKGYKEGPWLDDWTLEASASTGAAPDELPLALDITIETKTRGKINRVFMLSPGK